MDVSKLLLKLLQSALDGSPLPGWVKEMIVREISQCLTTDAISKLTHQVRDWLITELRQLEGPNPNPTLKLIYDALIDALGGDVTKLQALELAGEAQV